MDSAAVITVVCEPKHTFKKQSVMDQYVFAEAALEICPSAPMPREHVLVHCGGHDTLRPKQRPFANVIETDHFNAHTAAYLASTILGQD